MTCGLAIDAPLNDLQLLQRLIRYECVSMDISKCAVKAFSRHLWYLTAEMVPLALFSNKVPLDQLKSVQAACLLSSQLQVAANQKLDLAQALVSQHFQRELQWTRH